MNIIREFLDNTQTGVLELATGINCHRQTVQKWLSEESRPNIPHIDAIVKFAKGNLTKTCLLKYFYPEYFG